MKILNTFHANGSTWHQLRLWPLKNRWLTFSIEVWHFKGKETWYDWKYGRLDNPARLKEEKIPDA